MIIASRPEFVTFSPGVEARDETANYWMHQAALRLRRELTWRWRAEPQAPGDALGESLDLTRHWHDKQAFFANDATARYLSERIAVPDLHVCTLERGSFSWVATAAGLDPLARFTLGLALCASLDSASGPVIGACLNQPAASWPTLALVQKLWDDPTAALALADPSHPLLRYGLIHTTAADWNAPWIMPPLVARQLALPAIDAPGCLVPLSTTTTRLSSAAQLTAGRLRQSAAHLRVVPIQEENGGDGAELAASISSAAGRQAYEAELDQLTTVATVAWLRNADLLVRIPADRARVETALASLEALPLTIYLASDSPTLPRLNRKVLLPPLTCEPLSWSERVDFLRERLGDRTRDLEPAIAESARRFRFGRSAMASVGESLAAFGDAVTPRDLAAACRAETRLDIGDLAQPITPRFAAEELFLPEKQALQFQEVLRAMRMLTTVHYQWGTARVWNEGGISALFAGPPGTGKTMAAETLAHDLDLPMYRIDLSQVVNKYIGETEKNLKRLFDAADASDSVLFFDEADSLFGRRTETRDAHDRYANLEISYLLDRMERFKGLAILATNRKKDLDEAFLRRLRYIIDFPMPAPAQRLRMWMQSVPVNADRSGIDFHWLADAFPLAGGYIRSIVFNACLQAAHRGEGRLLRMEDVMVAVRREYEKMNRPITLQQFGAYADLIERVDREEREDQR